MNKVSMSHLISFSRYQTKCVIKFLFRQLMMSQTIRFMLAQPLKQWLTGRKRGEDGNTKMWISRERKELFRWNKKHFSQFLKGYHLGRNKNFIKNSVIDIVLMFLLLTLKNVSCDWPEMSFYLSFFKLWTGN